RGFRLRDAVLGSWFDGDRDGFEVIFGWQRVRAAWPALEKELAQEKDPVVWWELARASAERGNWQRSADACAKTLARKRDNWQIWYLAGIAQARLGRYEKALSHFAEALKQQPKAAGILAERGWAYAPTRQWYRAIADLRESLELHRDEEVLSWLALA